jgi:hypothetical protein
MSYTRFLQLRWTILTESLSGIWVSCEVGVTLHEIYIFLATDVVDHRYNLIEIRSVLSEMKHADVQTETTSLFASTLWIMHIC